MTIDETSVRVSWDRILLDEIANYTVYYRPVNSRKRQAGEMAVVVSGSQVSVEIRNLQTGTRYLFQVEATALLEDGKRLTGQRSPVVRQVTTNPTPTEGNNIQLRFMNFLNLIYVHNHLYFRINNFLLYCSVFYR